MPLSKEDVRNLNELINLLERIFEKKMLLHVAREIGIDYGSIKKIEEEISNLNDKKAKLQNNLYKRSSGS